VNFVSFFDAMRFTNWLHNGQGSADTETGAYTIGNGVNEVRSTNAKYWIPSLDEWYKAAYHDATAGRTGRYYDFPTTSNVAPNNNLPAADTGNSANYSPGGLTTGNRDYPLLDVGSYGRSDSPYGTFDQGGNVGEWVEAVTSSSARGLRGGSYVMNSNPMLAEFATLSVSPFAEYRDTGFRIAVPEPTTLALATMLAGCGMTGRRIA
jgi:formylglycine-generating enzyme required for sulfatase activity